MEKPPFCQGRGEQIEAFGGKRLRCGLDYVLIARLGSDIGSNFPAVITAAQVQTDCQSYPRDPGNGHQNKLRRKSLKFQP